MKGLGMGWIVVMIMFGFVMTGALFYWRVGVGSMRVYLYLSLAAHTGMALFGCLVTCMKNMEDCDERGEKWRWCGLVMNLAPALLFLLLFSPIIQDGT